MRRTILTSLMLTALAVTVCSAASLGGRIVDTGDNPVVDMQLALIPTDFHGIKSQAQTDDDGRFAFGNVKPGPYRLRLSTNGYAMHGVEALAIDADGAVAWEIAGPIEPGNEPIYTVGKDDRAQVFLVVRAPGVDAEPFQPRLERLGAWVREGRCADAVGELDAYVAVFEDNAVAHYLLGYCRATQGEAEAGAASLERALQIRPGMPGAALLLGQVYIGLGKIDAAVDWLRREAGGDADPGLRVEALMALGFVLRDAGRSAEAIEAFEQAVFLDPERPATYQELAALHLAQGDNDKAIETIVASAEAGPVNIDPVLNIGIGFYNDKDYARASEAFETAHRLAGSDADRANALALLGRCQFFSGEREAGRATLRRSLSLDPAGRFADMCRELLEQ